jgi:hypothetical protein
MKERDSVITSTFFRGKNDDEDDDDDNDDHPRSAAAAATSFSPSDSMEKNAVPQESVVAAVSNLSLKDDNTMNVHMAGVQARSGDASFHLSRASFECWQRQMKEADRA